MLSDHPPTRAIPGDSYILVAVGVGFSLPCLARGSVRGEGEVLNQSKSSIILKKHDFCFVSYTNE